MSADLGSWALFTLLAGLAVGAVLISTRLGISAAIVEIALGMVVANLAGWVPGLPSLLALAPNPDGWLALIASLGSVVLTFLAGSEIDPAAMRRTWKASLSIGVLSFLAPFLGAWWFALLVLRWDEPASLVTGVALSTTSVAVVYVVLVETGQSKTATGKLILSACFVTDLGTALALSLLFIRPNLVDLAVLAGATTAVALGGPRFLAWFFDRVRGLPGEPEVKVLLFLVVFLGALAQLAGSQAVLPAYILGLSLASVLDRNRAVLLRLRSMTLALLTPFFFLNAGLNVSFAALAAGLGILLLLFGVKVGSKFVGVLPVTQRLVGRDSMYIALLMSTGLTFGTIASTYGLTSGILTRAQFSLDLTVVLLTAIVPTLIAQRWFRPELPAGAEGPAPA